MLEQIHKSLKLHHNKHAFCIDDQFFSYNDLEHRISCIQHEIISRNLTTKNIGIITVQEFDSFAAILAILFSGYTFVPLSPDTPEERNHRIVQSAEIELVFSCIEGVLFKDCETIVLKNLTGRLSDVFFSQSEENDNVYLMYTSGSTGQPKGVPISHKNLNAFYHGYMSIGMNQDYTDRFLQMFELTFDLSVMSYLIPLTMGACVYTVPSGGIHYMKIYELLEEKAITSALVVPSLIAHLKPYFDEIRLEHMKYMLFCGEALYLDLTTEWQKCIPNAQIYNVYGPTEATIFCSSYKFKIGYAKEMNGIMCIGKAMEQADMIILDENDDLVKPGVSGALCLGGNQVTKGYWKEPEKNRQAFLTINGTKYYRSGDIAVADENGDIFFLGRSDNQVKVKGGFRVELSEIEYYAREYLQGKNTIAIAANTEVGVSDICLVVEGESEGLKQYLKTKLPDYMLPKEILQLDHFPLNKNGKTDRKAISQILNLNK